MQQRTRRMTLALAALVAALLLAACGGKSHAPTPATSAGGDVNATKTHIANLQATGTARALTPRATAPSGTPAPFLYKLGQLHLWLPLHYQANVYAVDTSQPPADGKTLLAIDAEECVQDSATPDISVNAQATDFHLTLSDGSDLAPGGPARDGAFTTKALTKGVCERGWITFELPSGASAAHISFKGTVKTQALTAGVTGLWAVTP